MANARDVPLRLLAQDIEDLEIISAALQDAVVKVGDIGFEPGARRLTLALNRYRWENPAGQRVRSAVQFGSVLGLEAKKINRGAKDAVLELLALTFEEGESPGGLLTFSFAGGADLRARVECIEAVMADVSRPWPTPRTPHHEV
jgi:hypothetical protein